MRLRRLQLKEKRSISSTQKALFSNVYWISQVNIFFLRFNSNIFLTFILFFFKLDIKKIRFLILQSIKEINKVIVSN